MPSKKKKKEPDKYKSLFSPKNKSDIICVKTSLKSILRNYDDNFPIINKLVIDCNNIVIRTYQFIRLFILNKYYKNEPIPEIDKDSVLYFIRAGGIRDNRGAKAKNKALEEELDLLYKNEFEPFLNKNKYSLINKTYITPYLAIQIQTGFNNNIKEHYITRVRRFLNIFIPNDLSIENDKDKEIISSKKKLWNDVKNSILKDKINECPEKYKDWALDIRNNYFPQTYEKCFGYDVKVNPNKYIFYTLKMNEKIEDYNNVIQIQINNETDEKKIKELLTLKKKLFQPVPLRNTIIPSYITLDANAILSFFKDKGEEQLRKNTKDNKKFIFNKIFKIEKKVLHKRDYNYSTILTDGIGVSIIFQKNKVEKEKKEDNEKDNNDNDLYLDELDESDLEIIKKRKIVSIDPGKSNLVYMLDESNNKLRYTTCQRRRESMRKRNNNIISNEKFKNQIQEKEAVLSHHNSKTVNYKAFQEYIKAKTILNEELKDFYQNELFRKLKWRTFVYNKSSEDCFLNKIEKTFGKKEETILCYGNWSNPKQMKYMMPSMGIGLRKIISKKFDVVLLNEFNTSKLCSCCHNKLENFINKEGKKEHRLLLCQCCGSNGSKSKKITFMNRDINACKNMLNLSKEWINHKTRDIRYSNTYGDHCKNGKTLVDKLILDTSIKVSSLL
jgi:hypothetical protein